MAVLLNHVNPYLRIYNPSTGDVRAFVGGKLEIEEGDPDYEVVMAEASRNPSIVVYATVTTCRYCGDVEKDKKALEAHVKDAHFAEWAADEDAAIAEKRNVEVKARAGVVCDVCRPEQTFPDEEALQLHIRSLHAAPPVLDDEGNEVAGSGDNAAATVDTAVPAAKKR